TYRLAGNLIWAQDIVARSDHDRLSYYGYFAVGLCAGLIAGITRVWANDQLILGHPTHPALLDCPPGWRLYRRDENQLPDPLSERQEGLGEVPAFRGLAYLVVDNLALAPFNNRVPTLTVEVVQHADLLPEGMTPVAEKQPSRRGRARNRRPSAPIAPAPASP